MRAARFLFVLGDPKTILMQVGKYSLEKKENNT